MSKKSRRVAKARRALLALSLVLVTMVVTVGGTIAWLTASTQEVTNTFTKSGISVDLTEDDYDNDGNALTNSYQIVPGSDIAKNPTLSAEADVPYYVFVSVTETNWPDWKEKVVDAEGNETEELKVKYELALTEANGWYKLEGVTLADGQTIYYKELAANEKIEEFSIIVGNTIYVSDQVNKDELAELGNPKIIVKAYAIQKANSADTIFTPAEAWAEVQ